MTEHGWAPLPGRLGRGCGATLSSSAPGLEQLAQAPASRQALPRPGAPPCYGLWGEAARCAQHHPSFALHSLLFPTRPYGKAASI